MEGSSERRRRLAAALEATDWLVLVRLIAPERLLVVRAGYGLALVARPAAMAGLAGGRPVSGREALVVRLAGLRHVAQAAALRARPGLTGVGATVDAAHALSMVVLAARDTRHRRLAGTEAGIAAGFAVAQLTTT